MAQYVESRELAAIAFYRKAACDVELKDKIEHRVWEWRTILEDGDDGAIHEALSRYKLRPNISFYSLFKRDVGGNLLDFADSTHNPLPDLESIFPAEQDPLSQEDLISEENVPSSAPLSSGLLLKIGLSVALGAAALLALCVLNVPLITASIGVGVIAAVAYAACSFFGQPQQNMEDSTAHDLASVSLNG